MDNRILDLSYHPMSQMIQCGDVFCSSNPMFLGKLINSVTALDSPDGESTYSHSGLFVSSYKVLEASWTVCLDRKSVV